MKNSQPTFFDRLILFFILWGLFLVIAQQCHAQCAERFTSAGFYYMPKTYVGAELQFMPSEGAYWGYIAGINVGSVKDTAKYGNSSYMDHSAYFKLLYRLNRHIMPTVGIGLRDLDQGYFMAGVRFIIPIGTAQSAFFIEPIYSTWKSTVHIGYAFVIQ